MGSPVFPHQTALLNRVLEGNDRRKLRAETGGQSYSQVFHFNPSYVGIQAAIFTLQTA